MTSKERVLERLQAAGDWVNGPELANEVVGGSEGLRRLRELRAAGYQIEERRHPDPRRSVWQYRLIGYEPPVASVQVDPRAPAMPKQPSPLRPGATPTPRAKYRCTVRVGKNGDPCDRELTSIVPYGISDAYVQGRCTAHGRVPVKA